MGKILYIKKVFTVAVDALCDREEFPRETKINTNSRTDIYIVRLFSYRKEVNLLDKNLKSIPPTFGVTN